MLPQTRINSLAMGQPEAVAAVPSSLGKEVDLSPPIILEDTADRVKRVIEHARIANRARRWMEQLDQPGATDKDIRYAQLAYLWDKLPHGWGTKYCLHYPKYGVADVAMHYSASKEKGHYEGPGRCGSVWVCPICANIITGKRRNELKKLLALTKYKIAMVTFTFSHADGDELKGIVNALNKAIRNMKRSRAWRRFVAKWGLVGHVYSLEVTHGNKNGWHPHRHELLVLDPAVFTQTGKGAKKRLETEMQADLYAMYRAQLNKVGLDCDEDHGVKVTANRRDYGSYVEKWGAASELSRGVSKQSSDGGKSVWALLSDAVRGDQDAWSLFMEYADAFKGHKQLHWSEGLRGLLALPKEKADAELAQTEAEPDDRIVIVLARPAWYYLVGKGLLGPLLKYCEGARGDSWLVSAFLARMGLRQGVYIPVELNPWRVEDGFSTGGNGGAVDQDRPGGGVGLPGIGIRNCETGGQGCGPVERPGDTEYCP